MTGSALNAWLDRLPRTRLGLGGRLVPTYRTLGVVGYYLALATVLGGTLVRGLSLLTAAGVAAASGLSFFLYARARKRLTGREEIVLLEHVWFAFAAVAALLWALGEPLLPHLDVFAVSLCPFLALGRVGCLLSGCCHGRPSRVGIVYGEEAARDGFPGHLVGVRLLPVPAFESLGLLLLGASGFAGLLWAAPGAVLVWFLVGYAVLRFGLDGLRGDGGPELLGFSEARWMCVVQFGFALGLREGLGGGGLGDLRAAAVWAGLTALLVAGLVLRRLWDLGPGLLRPAHLAEISGLLRSTPSRQGALASGVTSRGMVVAGSRADAGPAGWLHASFSLPGAVRDLQLLCRVAARVLPGLDSRSARYTGNGVLHVGAPGLPEEGARPDADSLQAFRTLYGNLVRGLQADSSEQGTGEEETGGRGSPAGRLAYFRAARPPRSPDSPEAVRP